MSLLSGETHLIMTMNDRVSNGDSFGLAIFKRSIDIVFGLIGLLVSLPVILICIAMIKIVDPGPTIYSQWRVGKNGWLFRLYKLRTMYIDAERKTGAITATRDDNRIIGLCRWMRQSHIDELPQLWNIVRGEMSLVGPRPERPEIHNDLCQDLPDFDQRLAVKPGLTGLAQVVNGYANDLDGNRKKLALDISYLKKLSWKNELMLLARTVPKLWDSRAN